MKKTILLLPLFICAFHSFGQELITVSKITEDSIAVKWLPSTFEQHRRVAFNEVIVSRIVSLQMENYTDLDFSNAKKWTIAPTKERFDRLDPNIPLQEKHIALIETVYETGLTDEI